MTRRWKAALTLIAVTPFITEVLTGNTPITQFIRPNNLILLTIAYMPALLIREACVRLRLNLFGAAILGAAYGIYNEGVCAQTLLLRTGVPISTFANYGFFGGINFSWFLMIDLWHLMFSVIFPFSIVHFLYPDIKTQVWLGKKSAISLFVLAVLTGTGIYVSLHKNSLRYLLLFWLVITALFFLARTFKGPLEKEERGIFSFKPVIAGFISIIFFVITFILSKARVPFMLFAGCYVLLFCLTVISLAKRDWLNPPGIVLFGIGGYMAFSFFALLGGITGMRPPVVYTAIVFWIIFIMLIFRIRRQYLR